MSPPASSEPASRRLFRQLVRDSDESAAVSLFVELCRASPGLRLWLWEEFARDPRQRSEFARHLKSAPRDFARFADLDGGGAAWQDETRRLREKFGGQSYGGLTFEEIKELLVRHQAGQGDAAAFLLALEWRRHGKEGAALPPRLLRAARDFLAAAFAPDGAELLRQLARAVELTEAFAERKRLRAALGFTDWWKLHLLLYIMRHPAAAYRTRDLHRHLRTAGLAVSPRAIRQFCTEHGIARDMRAGRPPPTHVATARPQRGKATSATPRAGRVNTSELHRP
jgi:hypothetical protein